MARKRKLRKQSLLNKKAAPKPVVETVEVVEEAVEEVVEVVEEVAEEEPEAPKTTRKRKGLFG